ncbi:hypothetical protein POSPLADRAFT_1130238 [Postia placenta MAD-698-R-SB12]|uniref:Zinc-finger domain-containing protein n=1 Tax=Postia placenta MAD-698-R-SB12 TaxID=670580 RepID=A0A1X6NHT4_9APHY|nr:hypothetical protein POSPLADRAFT_1130238 [Postia placenta MAD-698-R-SB12]OSX68175.1 hypothetical protein POSPLADRAFT_1130238 [Postia placenta MAD-698-R-SB12]
MVITSTAASSVVEDVPAPPKRFGPPVKAIKNSFHALAAEPTFCHQCRRTTQHDKMRCTVIKESGDLCGKRFCRNCVDKRSVAILFLTTRRGRAVAMRGPVPRVCDPIFCIASRI